MQHTLTKDISLSYNLGAEMNGATAEPIFIYTQTTVFTLSEKFGTYVELYRFAPQNNISEHRADGGITYYVHPNILVDLSEGSWPHRKRSSILYCHRIFTPYAKLIEK